MSDRHPEVLALHRRTSLEGRQPGCISAVHPSRFALRRCAPQSSRLRMTEQWGR